MGQPEYDDTTERRPPSPLRIQRRFPVLRATDAKGDHEELISATKLVGSAPEADVRVADREVSRIRCELEPTDHGAWIRDLASLNGTFVNGLRVTGAIVSEQAALQRGASELQLSYETGPLSDAPSRGFPAPELGNQPLWPGTFEQRFQAFRESWIDWGKREYVGRLLARCDWSVARAAQEAGVDRTYLYRLIRRHRP